MSYVFLPEWWGRGYARETCTAAIGLAFDRFPDAARLIAVTQEANTRSVRLLEALGMARVDAFEEFGARQVMHAIDRPGTRSRAWAGGGRANVGRPGGDEPDQRECCSEAFLAGTGPVSAGGRRLRG
ncbi:GNAT family N-acetyltransferase [Micromonospora sp. NPDC002296]|uniref:GNAT family N-acetyltransferase n=1 Tax=Micromonospora sp. NPDC002296 TaxID=3154271 RepID=UPI0033257DC6